MHRRRPLVLVAVAAIAAACRRDPVAAPELGTPSALAVEPREAKEAPRAPRDLRRAGACGTLKDSEEPDVLRLAARASGLVLYASSPVGLAVVDVTNPDDPLSVAISEFTGNPLGVFELERAAVVVFSPWDRPAETVIRAIDLDRGTIGRSLGEVVLEGNARDARRVGDAVVVSREVSGREGDETIVASFSVDRRLTRGPEVRLPGGGAVVGASPWGVAVAREADAVQGAERTRVTWLEIDDAGAMTERGTTTVGTVIPRWRGAAQHSIDVTEDARVRLIGCAERACTPGEAASYAAVDFAEPDRPHIVHSATIARAAEGVFAFEANRLLVARPPAARPSDVTELAIFDTGRTLEPLGAIRLPGTVGSIVTRHASIITVGWSGSATVGKRALVHHVEGRRAPRLLGSVAFGGDWTWSPAYDDERALSFDPASTLGALPMTTLRGEGEHYAAVQVLAFTPLGPRALFEREVQAAERLLFVDGRMLAFSSEGVSVVTFPGERRQQRRWDDLRSVR